MVSEHDPDFPMDLRSWRKVRRDHVGVKAVVVFIVIHDMSVLQERPPYRMMLSFHSNVRIRTSASR